ncbi:MAG TPA: toll/interleukin-1 receptor domain-containing protein [Verrucomicrobiae bacterium]|nr:toll/interleukin-1 receptor domain-containing protein [Verrucomicrobiae bacterium]
MRLFICHASEDKDDFVRPLAETLKNHYDLWYDEYRLTIGDSLLKKIGEGLASSDYGVVVLSKAFFGKQWTQAELDGLFALEGPSRKMILPVWHNVSKEEVAKFSPILAGRLGVPTSQGIEKVVEEIRRAVQVSDKQRELTKLEAAFGGLTSLDQVVSEKFKSGKLLDSVEGVYKVREAFQSVAQTLKGLEAQSQMAELLKLHVQTQQIQPNEPEVLVRGAFGLTWELQIVQMTPHSASRAVLRARVFEDHAERFGKRTPPYELRELHFYPFFRTDGKVIWREPRDRKAYGNEELVAFVIEWLNGKIWEKTKDL